MSTVNIDTNEIILNPDPDRVMQGLRDTGYDFNTAIADIIDNSIAAGADKIDIRVELDPMNEITVYITDNGCGMDFEGLLNAMKYGSNVRQDPSSLGKFGLGLKTASTAFCRSLSLVSTLDGEHLNKVRWDLDEIAKLNKWKLLTPDIEDHEEELLLSYANGSSGTLVIWEKVDRLIKQYTRNGDARNALKKYIEDLRFHISLVFQRFLDSQNDSTPKIEIVLNDEAVIPWDPFCKGEKNSDLLAEDKIEVVMPDERKAYFNIRAYIIPRKNEYSSKEEEKRARVSNDMQGFYIYREDRLIHHGDWMKMFAKEPHGTLLRVELSFDHMLDDAFQVDIKKSRILLNDQIFNFIKDSFLRGPRREADERYRKGKKVDIKNAGTKSAHEASNKNIEGKAAGLENSKVEVVDQDSGEVKISNKNGEFTGKIVIKSSENNGERRVVPMDNLQNGVLWEPGIVDAQHAVLINREHDYYEKVYYPIIENSVMVTGMDALLWSLAEAELSTYNAETREHYEEMRIMVSRILKKLISDLPDADFSEE